jgi:hypothetical protein
MKYLKKFNEAVDEKSIEQMKKDFAERAQKSILDSLKVEKNDILYYFSEFTDEYLYEYNRAIPFSGVNIIGMNIHFPIIKSLVMADFIEIVYVFWQPNTVAGFGMDHYIEWGLELAKFKKCLEQFKVSEENLVEVKKPQVEPNPKKIMLNFSKSLPSELKTQLKKELEEIAQKEKAQRAREYELAIENESDEEEINLHGLEDYQIDKAIETISEKFEADLAESIEDYLIDNSGLYPWVDNLDQYLIEIDFELVSVLRVTNASVNRILKIELTPLLEGSEIDPPLPELGTIYYNYDTREYKTTAGEIGLSEVNWRQI